MKAVPTSPSPLRAIAIAMITGYQRYLSPHKGFACAHRVLHGGLSCSEYVKVAIARYELIQAVTLSRRRFQACKQAKITLHNPVPELPPKPDKGKTADRENYCNGLTACDVLECIPCVHESEGCVQFPELECCVPECSGCDSGLDCASVDCCSWG